MQRATWILTMICLFAVTAFWSPSAQAFCGFYVAKAGTDLFNDASKVVIARHGESTTITMANDYRGEPLDFAMVVPVPHVLEREQINVRDPGLIDHIDAYTAPRLVEYFDSERCMVDMLADSAVPMAAAPPDDTDLGVTVEAQYTVGEYDIVILSAEESDGLETWLTANGYKIPQGASEALRGYLAAGMKFFVAKINLAEKAKSGTSFLRPLQISFISKNFMLPIKLGMVNASGPQELFIFVLTRKGRVLTTNYPAVEIPSDLTLPFFVQEDFGAFYKAMFDRAVSDNAMRAVFVEYAWDMNWCDPCAAEPLSVAQLRGLGAVWMDGDGEGGQQRDAFVTRLHVRYDAESFPNDLEFVETDNRENFQGRYIITHPLKEGDVCEIDEGYMAELNARHQQEAANLAGITNWTMTSILERMGQIQ